MRAFLGPDAKARVKAAVESIEQQSAAEVVVSVQTRSGDYRAADYLAGALLGFIVLLLLIYLPTEFLTETMPIDVLVAFVLGALVSARVAAVRRALVSSRTRDEHVRVAARATFYDLGISRTRARSGILVYVSLFERSVSVVPDAGVNPERIGAAWGTALAELSASISSFDRFIAALERLGPVLAPALPRGDDDINELPDEMDAS